MKNTGAPQTELQGWTGTVLPEGPVSIVKADLPQAAFVAVAKGQVVSLALEQLSPFLQCHSERRFFCRDVPALIRVVRDLTENSHAAAGVLWQAVREYRCLDRTLMHQRGVSVRESYYARAPEWIRSSTDAIAKEIELVGKWRAKDTYAITQSCERYPKKFGIYGVGIDIQAAVALADAGEMEIADGALQRLDGALRETIARSRDVLERQASDCFRRTGNHVKWHKKRLRAWLYHRFWDLRDRFGRPLYPPRVGPYATAISTRPRDWGHLALCHPSLRAWRDHTESMDLQRFLQEYAQQCSSGTRPRFRPTYELIPTTRITEPNLAFLHELLPGATRPPEDRRWVIGRLSDLDLRCFVAISDRHGPDRSPRGLLSQLVRQPVDQDDLTSEQSVLDPLTKAFTAATGEHSYSTSLGDARRATEVLAFGLTRWLALEHIRILLNEALGVSLTARDAEQVQQAFLNCVPEIESLYDDIVLVDFPRLHDHELSADTNPVICRAECLPGRIGMPGISTQARIHEFLELADSVMKHVVFELAAHGHRLVAFCGDEFIIEAPGSAGSIEHEVAAIASHAAEELVQGVFFPCRCRLAWAW